MNAAVIAVTLALIASLAALGTMLVRTAEHPHTPRKVWIYVDKDTGCQYVRGGQGITPRMSRDGKHICTLGATP